MMPTVPGAIDAGALTIEKGDIVVGEMVTVLDPGLLQEMARTVSPPTATSPKLMATG